MTNDAVAAPDDRPRSGRTGVVGAALVGLLTVTLAQVALPISDPDSLWHLVLGRRLATTGQFVLAPEGLLTRDYLYNQWLPELGGALIERWWGLSGVAVAAHVVRALVLAATYLAARRYAGPLASGALTALVLVAGLGAFTARPQLVGLLTMVVCVDLWQRTGRDARPRWWLVPLSAVWAASHGSWLIGAAVGAVTVAGLAVRRRSVTGLRGPVAVLVACGLVGLAMPPGLRWFEQLTAIREVSWLADEWQRPSLGSPHLVALLVLVAVVVLGWIRRRTGRPDPVDVFTLALAIGLGVTAYRGLAFAAVLVTPLAARQLGRRRVARSDARTSPGAATSVSSLEGLVLAAGAAASIAVAVVSAPVVAATPARVPVGVTPALAALAPGTVVANDLALGGWLVWSQPDLVPVWDTRLDAYGPEHLRAAQVVFSVSPGWDRTLTTWGVGAAVVPRHSPLAAALTDQLGWHETATDAGFVVLVPSAR